MFTICKLSRDSKFSYQPGSSGVESTFDIVFEETGDIVASLFYWEAEKETEEDTRVLVDGLDRLYRRGGSLELDALKKLNDVLKHRYYDTSEDTSLHSTTLSKEV